MINPERYHELAEKFRRHLQTAKIACARWWFRPYGKLVGAEDFGEFCQEKNTPIEHLGRLVVHLLPFDTVPEYCRLRSLHQQVAVVFTEEGDFLALRMERKHLTDKDIGDLRSRTRLIFSEPSQAIVDHRSHANFSDG